MIRFESEKSQGFSMLDADAEQMLDLMKHSGSVPGAIRAEDIAATLDKLRASLEAEAADVPVVSSSEADTPDDEQVQSVALGTRAYPLVQLLEAAQEKQEAVMWDYDNSII